MKGVFQQCLIEVQTAYGTCPGLTEYYVFGVYTEITAGGISNRQLLPYILAVPAQITNTPQRLPLTLPLKVHLTSIYLTSYLLGFQISNHMQCTSPLVILANPAHTSNTSQNTTYASTRRRPPIYPSYFLSYWRRSLRIWQSLSQRYNCTCKHTHLPCVVCDEGNAQGNCHNVQQRDDCKQ